MAVITGEVAAHFAKGIRLRDQDGGQQWTIWTDHRPGIGDTVTVRGKASGKVGKPYTGRDGIERTGVDLSLNDAEIQFGAQEETSYGEWDRGDTETPF